MDPSLTVKLGSPVMSVLSEVLVDRGDLVKKGQVIATVESAVEEAAVATNEARAASTAEKANDVVAANVQRQKTET